jgi:hypothetical protein
LIKYRADEQLTRQKLSWLTKKFRLMILLSGDFTIIESYFDCREKTDALQANIHAANRACLMMWHLV